MKDLYLLEKFFGKNFQTNQVSLLKRLMFDLAIFAVYLLVNGILLYLNNNLIGSFVIFIWYILLIGRRLTLVSIFVHENKTLMTNRTPRECLYIYGAIYLINMFIWPITLIVFALRYYFFLNKDFVYQPLGGVYLAKDHKVVFMNFQGETIGENSMFGDDVRRMLAKYVYEKNMYFISEWQLDK